MPDLLAQLQEALADRYRVDRELGQGGMATVYLAADLKHNRQVALKVLRPELAALLGAERFLREIATTARLSHPGILPLLDSGSDTGVSWYAMPLVTGKTLRDRLKQGGPLPLDQALRIFADVAGALDHAHRQGVLHRDLKPANILLQDERAVLADFGIALPLDGVTRLTETGFTLGTAEYMSPEQAAGERGLDVRSDVYALGCVLYEMLAGEPPFTGPNAQAVLAKRLSQAAPKVGTLREVPPAVEAALGRALARAPADRFATVAEFAAAVAGDRPPPAPSLRASLRGRRGSLVLVAVVATVLAGAWFVGQGATGLHRSGTDRRATGLYQQGQAQLQRRTQTGLDNAVALFRQAIAVDSGSALGWAGLADAMEWARIWRYTVPAVPAESLLVRELAASDRALALDSTDLDLWLLRGGIATAIDPTRREGEIHAIRRALALDSLSAKAWAALGWALEDALDSAGAVAALRRSVALGEHPVALANHFYWHRAFDSAAVWADSGVVMNPQLPWAHETVGAVALARHRLAESEAAYDAARRLDTGPTAVRSLEGLAEVAATRGDAVHALELIRQAEGLIDPAHPSLHGAISLGSAYAAVNDPGHALAWLERYQPRMDLHFQLHLKHDLMLDRLRPERRFQALLRKE